MLLAKSRSERDILACVFCGLRNQKRKVLSGNFQHLSFNTRPPRRVSIARQSAADLPQVLLIPPPFISHLVSSTRPPPLAPSITFLAKSFRGMKESQMLWYCLGAFKQISTSLDEFGWQMERTSTLKTYVQRGRTILLSISDEPVWLSPYNSCHICAGTCTLVLNCPTKALFSSAPPRVRNTGFDWTPVELASFLSSV